MLYLPFCAPIDVLPRALGGPASPSLLLSEPGLKDMDFFDMSLPLGASW